MDKNMEVPLLRVPATDRFSPSLLADLAKSADDFLALRFKAVEQTDDALIAE